MHVILISYDLNIAFILSAYLQVVSCAFGVYRSFNFVLCCLVCCDCEGYHSAWTRWALCGLCITGLIDCDHFSNSFCVCRIVFVLRPVEICLSRQRCFVFVVVVQAPRLQYPLVCALKDSMSTFSVSILPCQLISCYSSKSSLVIMNPIVSCY